AGKAQRMRSRQGECALPGSHERQFRRSRHQFRDDLRLWKLIELPVWEHTAHRRTKAGTQRIQKRRGPAVLLSRSCRPPEKHCFSLRGAEGTAHRGTRLAICPQKRSSYSGPKGLSEIFAHQVALMIDKAVTPVKLDRRISTVDLEVQHASTCGASP